MRTLFFFCLLGLALTAASAAADVTPCRDPDAKSTTHLRTNLAYDRQGGDTVAEAMPIAALPFTDSGATCDNTDDYAGECLNDDGAPDVVYSYSPAQSMNVTIDLCGSSYDTGVYVYDSHLEMVACNDDACGLQSRLENLSLLRGVTYYIIVDGYGDDCGAYVLSVTEYVPCQLVCPPGAALEGEPPLIPNYEDLYNDGCCGGPGDLMMSLWGHANGQRNFCGRSGWFTYAGSSYRDTDWFVATFGPSGVIEVRGDAEYETYLFELGPQDCAVVGVVQQVTVGRCDEDVLTVTGQPGSTVWLWAGPTVFAPPDGSTLLEYGYVLRMNGLASEGLTGVVEEGAVMPSTWSNLKSLYR